MIDLANLPIPHPRQLPSGDAIRHSKSIIEQLDQNIEDLGRDIEQLQKRLQEVQQKRANYVSYISPLRRLPTEILSEIIGICIQNNVDITIMAGICSRLREVVLGMAGIWSNISLHDVGHPHFDSRFTKPYGSSIFVSFRLSLAEVVLIYPQKVIHCTTVEQIALALTRAGSTPLDLRVLWPVEIGTLELISSQNCLIRSLAVVDESHTPLNIFSFQNLDLSQLQEISLSGLQWDQSRIIMDLALQSSCRSMVLNITSCQPALDLLRHDLIKRMTEINIMSGQ
jgi:hypothetical protein